MQHHIYADHDNYPTAVLVKNSSFNLPELKNYYVDALEKQGINREELILVGLPYNENGKAPVGFIKTQLETLLPGLKSLGVKRILCCDAAYFKVLTKQTRAEPHLGYVLPCVIEHHEDLDIVLGVNHKTVLYDPKNQDKVNMAVTTLAKHIAGSHQPPGKDIAAKARYLTDYFDIMSALEQLFICPRITCDIEGFSLRFDQAGIGTITFCWNEEEGIAFPVDYKPLKQPDEKGRYGVFEFGMEVRDLLREFFEAYPGEIIWHNANYDLKVLIYSLWMNDLLDVEGMLKGLHIMCEKIHDTKIIAYLATNSTAGNELGLKVLAHEFAGNWAKDVRDISKVPLDELLQYNFIDGVSTWYVFNKYYPKMVEDQQEELYYDLFLPSQKTIIQTEMAGMPMSKNRIQEVKHELETAKAVHEDVLVNSPTIQKLNEQLQREAMEAANAKLKTKQHPLSKFSDVVFNPNSNPQCAKLLYELLALPVIDYTDSGKPATGSKTLAKLINHTDDPESQDILSALIGFSEIEKILNSFIPAFENAINKGQSDIVWLHGSFNLGGTVSGRLSSCVAPWTCIKTSRGFIPITKVRIGDFVWTHRRRWKQVLDVIEKPQSEMVDIQFCNGYVLSCTTAHKLNVPNRGWTTVQEIIDERIEKVDAEHCQYSERVGAVSGTRENQDCTRNCKYIANNATQCIACFEESDSPRKIETLQSSPILSFQNRRVKSNERQNWKAASQLYRGLRRWLRLSNPCIQGKTSVCPQNCDGQSSWIRRIARLFSCTSYRRQPAQQQLGQSCTLHFNRAQGNPQPTSNNSIGKIKAIYNRSVTPVWDLTVADDHSYWAEGCFNHNSDPNLQNLPSNSTYGNLIKSCFVTPPGCLFVGADFNSLEDYVSALQTKDPNKLRVYEDGYDGHCLRAFYYFGDQMPDIEETPNSINSIKKKYPELRQASKGPTFLLTYGGTHHGLMTKLGWPKEKAQQIEDSYHELYKVSDEWVQARLAEAAETGFVECAFGLRVRTPLLARTLRNTRSTPYEAKAESRTAGNALGQSYGLLTNRALNAFMEKVWASEHCFSILPIGLIHDALYFVIKDDLAVLEWVNTHLIDELRWQELPDIRHDKVKLGAELSVFWPSWKDELSLPNDISAERIQELCDEHYKEQKQK